MGSIICRVVGFKDSYSMGFKKVAITSAFLMLLIYGLLVVSLVYFFRWNRFLEILLSSRTLFSIQLSIVAATIATVFSVILAIPSAYALSRYQFPGKLFIDTILELPMIVSPAALGAMILIFFNTPFGDVVEQKTVRFIFTFYGVVLAQFIATAGVATRLIKAVMDEVPKRFEDVGRSLGATSSQVFLKITLPISRKGIAASVILTWAKALGEFGATMMVAGTMAKRTETLPIAIFARLSTADIEGAVVLILVLLFIGFGLLYVVRIFFDYAKSKKPLL